MNIRLHLKQPPQGFFKEGFGKLPIEQIDHRVSIHSPSKGIDAFTLPFV